MVKRHVSTILSKLEAGNRTQAMARARTLGLLSEEERATLLTSRSIARTGEKCNDPKGGESRVDGWLGQEVRKYD